MAIEKMSKITLIGVKNEKQILLDKLFASKIVELKSDIKEAKNNINFFDQEKYDALNLYCTKLERAILSVEEKLPLDTKLETVFDISTEEFEKLECKRQKVDEILQEIDKLQNELSENKKEKVNLENKLNQFLTFKDVKEKFSDFKPTKHTQIMLGTINNSKLKELSLFFKDCELSTFEFCGAEQNVIKVYSHNFESANVVKKLNELGFSKTNINLDICPKEAIKQLVDEIKENNKIEEKLNSKFLLFAKNLKDLKIMRDYIKYCLEKEDAENKFRSTQESFILDGFLAKCNEEKLKEILDNLPISIEYEFSKPKKDEMPPTITKNNKVVSQFEFVTNMYSAPHYRELDPNTFIAIFFSLFFGFIMADIGYGLCLTVFGLILALKQKRATGVKKLWYVLSVGGLASILFGVLFGSFFGVALPCFDLSENLTKIFDLGILICLALSGLLFLLFLLFKILYKLVKTNEKLNNISDIVLIVCVVLILVASLVGSLVGKVIPVGILPNPVNNVITMLVACLAAGVVQIMVSFILKGVLLIRRGKVLEAVFSAFTWDFFFVGLALFALEFAGIYKGLGSIGIYVAIGSVGICVIGLAIINKGFNRFSKGFGAVYGIINLFSDILSYARLFGLMLSGAIIASIVNQLAEGFLNSPLTFVIGAVILFIGHAFNLAMGALGAYIHVARLQYIEFFSRFYEGEGELFVPFGQTNFQYVNLI